MPPSAKTNASAGSGPYSSCRESMPQMRKPQLRRCRPAAGCPAARRRTRASGPAGSSARPAVAAHEVARSEKAGEQPRIVAIGSVAGRVQHPHGQRVRPHRHHVAAVVRQHARVRQIADRRRHLEAIARPEQRTGRAEHGRVAHERGARSPPPSSARRRTIRRDRRQHATCGDRRDLATAARGGTPRAARRR